MKNLYKKISKKWLMAGFASLLLTTIVFVSCVYLDSVEYESTLKAGDDATFTVDMHIDASKASTRLIFSLLVPKSWNATQNTTVTYTDTYNEGIVKTMSVVSSDVAPKNCPGMTWDAALKEKYGVGPNVLNDMEWITFQSDEMYEIFDGDKQNAKISIVTKVGPENMRFKLGFFVNHSDDGLSSDEKHYKVLYSDCIEVIDGEGELIDFCEMHFNLLQPSNATKDDILTVKFQGEAEANDLDNANEIYLIAKAFTNTGHEYALTERTAKTKMINEEGKTYSLTFWAADYFGIPANEEILRIEYYFTNEDGSKSVMQTYETGEPATWFLSMLTCK
ncbi:MAG: DUF4961 domain-containing protein [Candidatus Symbiothrix sp.]|jgi:hypothetical protein|nr:DUF4961 domain-containing protein [Candidatus Symbiothrix sp.]